MKKLGFIACFLFCVATVGAQHSVNSFFDRMGVARIQTVDYSGTHDTIINLDPRMDDVIWSRIVYRIVDMRYKQNYQLYFPTTSTDPHYRSLLKVITDAVIDGMPIYQKNDNNIKPNDFEYATPLTKEEIPQLFLAGNETEYQKSHNTPETQDSLHLDITKSSEMAVLYDPSSDSLRFNAYAFDGDMGLAKNQLKYLTQEMVYFDKHTSRLYTKIIAIAPLYADRIDSKEPLKALHESIMFWIPFNELRPYLALQYIIPSQNETKRVTYDDFFQKRLYSSYIIGEGNIYNRFIPEYCFTEEEIKKEQARIEQELLTFEQDLWEY